MSWRCVSVSGKTLRATVDFSRRGSRGRRGGGVSIQRTAANPLQPAAARSPRDGRRPSCLITGLRAAVPRRVGFLHALSLRARPLDTYEQMRICLVLPVNRRWGRPNGVPVPPGFSVPRDYAGRIGPSCGYSISNKNRPGEIPPA